MPVSSLWLLAVAPTLAQDVVLREPLTAGSGADTIEGGTFTGGGWRVDAAGDRMHWDLGAQLDRGAVSVTIDDITLETLQNDNNHLVELFDEGGHFDSTHAINFRVYGSADPASHGDVKLKVWDGVGGAEARGGIQDWDGNPHRWTITWDPARVTLDRDGVRLIDMDVTGLDLRVGHLWLPLEDWIPGSYDCPIGAVYSDLALDGWASTDGGPGDDGDPTTFLPVEDAGLLRAGGGDVDDLPIQGEGGVPAEASYLLYDLSSVSGPVASATLRLHVRDDGSAGGSAAGVYAVADTSWTEEGVTWDTRPAAGALLGALPATSPGQIVDVDVTAGVRAGGRVAFALVGSGDDGVHVSSKEAAGGADAAVLTVLLGTGPDDTAGTTPTGDDVTPTDTGDGPAGGVDEVGDPDGASGAGKEAREACGCAAAGRGTPAFGILGLLLVRRRRARLAEVRHAP